MQLNKTMEYAVTVLSHLDSTPKTGTELFQLAHCPYQLLVRILYQMRCAGIVGSQKGRGGGYIRLRETDAFELAELFTTKSKREIEPILLPAQNALNSALKTIKF